VAPALYTPGRAVQMRVVAASVAASAAASGGDAASRDAWLMVFRAEAHTRVSVRAEPALLRGIAGGAQQQMRLDIAHYGDLEPADVSIALTSDGVTSKSSDHAFALEDGYLTLRVPIPMVSKPATATVTVRIANRVQFDGRVPVTPVKPASIYLLHHSHLDIGYTHVQGD